MRMTVRIRTQTHTHTHHDARGYANEYAGPLSAGRAWARHGRRDPRDAPPAAPAALASLRASGGVASSHAGCGGVFGDVGHDAAGGVPTGVRMAGAGSVVVGLGGGDGGEFAGQPPSPAAGIGCVTEDIGALPRRPARRWSCSSARRGRGEGRRRRRELHNNLQTALRANAHRQHGNSTDPSPQGTQNRASMATVGTLVREHCPGTETNTSPNLLGPHRKQEASELKPVTQATRLLAHT